MENDYHQQLADEELKDAAYENLAYQPLMALNEYPSEEYFFNNSSINYQTYQDHYQYPSDGNMAYNANSYGNAQFHHQNHQVPVNTHPGAPHKSIPHLQTIDPVTRCPPIHPYYNDPSLDKNPFSFFQTLNLPGYHDGLEDATGARGNLYKKNTTTNNYYNYNPPNSNDMAVYIRPNKFQNRNIQANQQLLQAQALSQSENSQKTPTLLDTVKLVNMATKKAAALLPSQVSLLKAPAVAHVEKTNDLSMPEQPIPDRGVQIRERSRFKRCMRTFFDNLKNYGVCNPNLANLKKSTPNPEDNPRNKIRLVPNFLPFDSTFEKNPPCWHSDLPITASTSEPLKSEENLLHTRDSEDCEKYSMSELENILNNEVSIGFIGLDPPVDTTPPVETRVEKCTETDYHVPVEYLVYQFVKENLAKIDCRIYNDELLFYIYYTIEEDQIKLAAITNLFQRRWRYYLPNKAWVRLPMSYNTGQFYTVFDPTRWEYISTTTYIDTKKIERDFFKALGGYQSQVILAQNNIHTPNLSQPKTEAPNTPQIFVTPADKA